MSAADPWLAGVVAPLLGSGPLPPRRAREAASPMGDERRVIRVDARTAETRPLTPMEMQAIDQRRRRVAMEQAVLVGLRRGEVHAAIAQRLSVSRSLVDGIARRHGVRAR